MRVVLLSMVILAIGASHGQAQSPPLAATVSWIVDHLPTHNLDSDAYTAMWERTEYSGRGCTIHISDATYGQAFSEREQPLAIAPYFVLTLNAAAGRKIKSTPVIDLPVSERPKGTTFGFRYAVEIDLGQIDSNHITVRKTANHAEWGLGAALDGASITFAFHGADAGSLAARVATAFKHSIHVCGGRSDIF